MSDGEWFVLDGTIEPLAWGGTTYTVFRVSEELVAATRAAGTKRVGGTIEDAEVDLAIQWSPVVDWPFVWAGRSLLARLDGVRPGDPVQARLRPRDDQVVDLPEDVADALDDAGALDLWEALTPGGRRGLMQRVTAARTEPTRRRRIELLVDAARG